MRPKKLFHTIVVVGAALTGGACGSTPEDSDAGAVVADAGAMIADAAMDAAMDRDAGAPEDAGEDEDAMVLIL